MNMWVVAYYLHAVLFLNQNFFWACHAVNDMSATNAHASQEAGLSDDLAQVSCEGSRCSTEVDMGLNVLQQQVVNEKNSRALDEPSGEAEATKPVKDAHRADIVADEAPKHALEQPPSGHENLVLEERESLNLTASHVLIVTIQRANNLETEWWEHRDPYVEFQIVHKDSSKRTTKTVHDNQHPTWNEKVHYGQYQPGDALYFKIWDEDHDWDDALGEAYFKPNCKQTGVKTLPLSTTGTLTVKIECVGSPKVTHVESMVNMASDVYGVHKKGYTPAYDLGDWDLVMHKREWGDNLAVYQNGNQCTLAFTGSETLQHGSMVRDWVTNAWAFSKSRCGNEIHSGFYNEVWRSTVTWNWNNKMQPFLASDACSGGIYVVGHSLGGAAASVFTSCVNQDKKWLSGKGFKVKEVYTIGAPAVSKKPLRQADGCLKGLRIYNEDKNNYDLVPFLAQWAGMVHPNLKAMIVTKKSETVVEETEFDCNSKEAVSGDKRKDEKLQEWKVISNGLCHIAGEYVKRMKTLFSR